MIRKEIHFRIIFGSKLVYFWRFSVYFWLFRAKTGSKVVYFRTIFGCFGIIPIIHGENYFEIECFVLISQ